MVPCSKYGVEGTKKIKGKMVPRSDSASIRYGLQFFCVWRINVILRMKDYLSVDVQTYSGNIISEVKIT